MPRTEGDVGHGRKWGTVGKLFSRSRADVRLAKETAGTFGQDDPVRAQIALLRERRDAGDLTTSEFVRLVNGILGGHETVKLTDRV